MTSIRFAFVAILLIAPASAAAATIYKCFDLDGKISYQDQPCDETALSTTIEVQAPRPPAPPSSPAAPSANAGADSPRTAWSQMTLALGAGRIDEAVESIAPELRDNYRKMFRGLDVDGAHKMANTLGALIDVKFDGADPDSSNAAVGTLRAPGGRVSEARFARVAGRWYVGKF
jgi:hypothetical protein